MMSSPSAGGGAWPLAQTTHQASTRVVMSEPTVHEVKKDDEAEGDRGERERRERTSIA